MKLRMPEMPPATLIAALECYNLLPAIVFLPTRRRCDQAASEAALTRRDPNDTRREARRDFMRVPSPAASIITSVISIHPVLNFTITPTPGAR